MLLDKIKSYFTKKSKEEETGLAPEGICPNCWGYTEWKLLYRNKRQTYSA